MVTLTKYFNPLYVLKLTLLPLCCLSTASYAHISYEKTIPHHIIFSLGGGASISNGVGKSKNFPVINPDTDSFYNYTANKPSKTKTLIDGFIGAEWIVDPRLNLQLGLDINQATGFRDEGSVLQGADIQSSDLYQYGYSIASRQLLVESKWLYRFKQRIQPYFLLGLGAGFNSASGFTTTVPPFLTFTRDFSNHSNTSFSYNIGLGVDMDLTDNLRLGLGYRFADRGTVQLGSSSINGTSVSGTLPSYHLYTNEVLAQVSVLLS